MVAVKSRSASNTMSNPSIIHPQTHPQMQTIRVALSINPLYNQINSKGSIIVDPPKLLVRKLNDSMQQVELVQIATTVKNLALSDLEVNKTISNLRYKTKVVDIDETAAY